MQLILIPALFLLSSCAANSNGQFLELSLNKREGHSANRIFKRGSDDNSNTLPLVNAGTFYKVELEVGTPPQNLEFLLDTGSSDFWLDSVPSHTENTFDYTSSKTFEHNNTEQDFVIGYGDHSKVSGFWASDNVSIFDHNFRASFGVANESDSTMPVMGIGLTQGEISVTAVDSHGVLSPTYPNFPKLLQLNGLIRRNAYSIWLQNHEKGNGTVLFGGVDHSKYQGTNLSLVPIISDGSIPAAETPTTLSVMLHGANLTGEHSDFSAQINKPVLLDTGSTMCQLPTSFVDQLGQSLNGEYSSDFGLYAVDCNAGGIVNFNLSGVIIPVPVTDLVMNATATNSDADANQCVLGIYGNDKSKYILGDAFLRNAYVAFDLEGLQAGIAPGVAGSTETDTEPSRIEAIVSKIPGASMAPLYSQTASA